MFISRKKYFIKKEEVGFLLENLYHMLTCPAQICLGLGVGRGRLGGNMLHLPSCYLFMVLKMLSPLEESNATNFFIDL